MIKLKKIKYDDFINKFNGKDKEKIKSFFNKLDRNIDINKKDKRRIITDFENYILYFKDYESISKIIKKIDDYSYKKSRDWYPLDNSSKIYPLSMQEDWMSIYRLSYYMNDDVNPIVLQIALLFTMNRFPLFRTSVHKGFFNNYLDTVNKRFNVKEENKTPCSKINISKFNTQLFRVIYYGKRISCEFFHLISDATGGMVFLTTLVNEYLRLLGKNVSYNEFALNPKDKPNKEELTDAFENNKTHEKGGSLVEDKALEIDGRLSVIRPCQVLHFDLDLNKVHKLAKENDVTINELLLTFLFLVLSYSTSKNGFIKIQVPINLRKYYHTKTLRNYSLYTTISMKKSSIKDFDGVLTEVKRQSRENITKEKLDKQASRAVNLVKNVTFIPLFIKRPIANFIYRVFGDKSSTTVLSNLGMINIPIEMQKEVDKVDFVLGTNLTNRILFSVISINNTLTLSLSKFTSNKSVDNNLYSLLKEHDLITEIHGSDEYDS